MKTPYTPADHAEMIRSVLALNEMDCGAENAALLSDFLNELLTVNQFMNLTAIVEPEAAALKHFADSVSLSPYLPTGARVADIGTGAGFPTLPLAIVRRDLRFTAIDGTEKRVNFVRETVKKLSLCNVGALAGRAELLSKEKMHRERYDAVVARAVARLNVLCELCLPFVRVGGIFVSMKSLLAEEELEEAKTAVETLGGKLVKVETFTLRSHEETVERTVAVIEKTAPTPPAYPRSYSLISKKPL